MIQQVSTANTAPSSNQMRAGEPQSTDGFGSMLKDAVQKQGFGSADKTGGRKSEQSKKTDESEQGQTENGQAQQSALLPGTLILPNAAALFVSDSGGNPVPQTQETSDATGSGLENNTSVQAAPEISLQATAALFAEKDAQEPSGQTLAAGAAMLQDGDDTRKPESPRQELSNGASALPVVEEQLGDQTLSARGTAQLSQTGSAPADAVQPQSSVKAVSTENESTADSGRGTEAKEGQSVGAQEPTAFSVSDAKSEEPAHISEALQTARSPGAKDTAVSATDTSAAAGSGLSALYDNGKVVIKVSGEPAQANVSPPRQVADAAVRQMQSGKTEFQMDLYPQSLGKVSVKFTSQNGLLTVELAASNPKTQSLLASGSAEIRSILQASAGQNVQTVIPQQQTQQWYGQSWDGEGGSSGNRRQKQDESSRRDRQSRVDSVSTDLSAGDFLSMMQKIAAYAQ